MSRVERARALLDRPGAWLDAADGRYALRLAPGRKVRVHLLLDESAFLELVARPGLSPRPDGGWSARASAAPSRPPSGSPPGRPGFVAGERLVDEDGHPVRRASNLGTTAIAWLASRRDAEGRPLLAPVEVAAGARLTQDAEIAGRGPSMTMRWDALPRSGGGSAARVEPTGAGLAAWRRVEMALRACGPARGLVTAICVRGSALQVAERRLGLKRRSGKDRLREGLQALAGHYGMG